MPYFMPPQQDYIAPAILEEAYRSEQARLQRFKKALGAYLGQIDKPLVVNLGEYDDNVVLSFPRMTVDKSVSALFGQEIDFEVDAESESDTETDMKPADQWLEACWEANKKMSFLHNLGINGGIFGHAFVKVDMPKRPGDYPRLLNLDPMQMSVIWDSKDIEEILQFTQKWTGIDPLDGRAVTYRQITYRDMDSQYWRIRNERSKGGSAWMQEGAEIVWDYEWSPIFCCQNLPCPNEFWGLADINPDVLSIHDSVCFVASNINRILRYYAHPLVWAKGVGGDDIERSPGNIVVLRSPNGELHSLEMQSDLSSSLSYLSTIMQHYHEVTHTPEVASGKLENVGTLSGVALKILYSPLLEKINTKQMFYGDMLQKLNLALLELGGFGTDHTVAIKWQSPIPGDELGEAQVAKLHHELGVSEQTILTQLGYDASAEMQKSQAENQAAIQEQQQRINNAMQATVPNNSANDTNIP
jgi:hypothetical protein